ncbi:hypothetical protein ACOMHN_006518 [Nucella lapillus]
MRKRKETNKNEELKQLVNDVQHGGKGAAPSEGSARILRVGRSNLDIDVPHGGRMNCLVSPLRLSRLKQGPHWDLRAQRINSPRQSLERLRFSQRGVFLRKRCTSLSEIRLRPFIFLSFTYGVLNHCPMSGHAVDQ